MIGGVRVRRKDARINHEIVKILGSLKSRSNHHVSTWYLRGAGCGRGLSGGTPDSTRLVISDLTHFPNACKIPGASVVLPCT